MLPAPGETVPTAQEPYYNATDAFREAAAALADAGQAIDAAARALRRVADVRPDVPESAEHLRGARLAEVIVEVGHTVRPERWPLHYRDWFSLVERAGYRVGGRDPVATFLTQLTRVDGVESEGARTGLYRLATAAEAA